jgi:hypothetical protein
MWYSHSRTSKRKYIYCIIIVHNPEVTCIKHQIIHSVPISRTI